MKRLWTSCEYLSLFSVWCIQSHFDNVVICTYLDLPQVSMLFSHPPLHFKPVPNLTVTSSHFTATQKFQSQYFCPLMQQPLSHTCFQWFLCSHIQTDTCGIPLLVEANCSIKRLVMRDSYVSVLLTLSFNTCLFFHSSIIKDEHICS